MDRVEFGLNQYCGPAVLSIFTGLDTDTCAEAISKVNGKHAITGVVPSDLIAAGEILGIEIRENPAFKGRSLFWAASAMTHFRETKWIIVVPRHYIAIEVDKLGQIQICDNHTKEPMALENSARLSQKVEAVYSVKKVREYIKPYEVSRQLIIEKSYNNIIMITQERKFSDDKVKSDSLGTILTLDPEILLTIADRLTQFAEEK